MRKACTGIALAAFLASACATVEVRTEQRRIAIATDAFLVLPQAGALTDSINATQVIVAEYEDHSYSFEALVEARPGRITIAALNSFGGTLFSITFDGHELLTTGTVETQTINSEYVLADVLLTHWDPAWLNQRLEGASIEVAEDGKGRFVSRGNELIIGITYESENPWGGTAQLTHMERGYVLQIKTAEFERQ